MVAPVTGPFTTIIADNPYWYETRWGYRQKKPYTDVLPHDRRKAFWDPNATTHSIALPIAFLDTVSPEAYGHAYARFVAALGDTASLGVSLVQYRQAHGMIKTRALQLAAFATALVRRNPQGVSRALGIPLKAASRVMRPSKYGASRDLANLWLEFWFGWKPMVGDIYSACEVLSNPLPNVRIKGSGKAPFRYVQDSGLPASRNIDAQALVRVRLGADVAIVNPQLRLFQQLGLINPYVVAFDAIPWSFVLGWFSNINSYLSSFTDFAGLTMQRAYQVTDVAGKVKTWWHPCSSAIHPGCTEADVLIYQSWLGKGEFYSYRRVPLLSIPYPQLSFHYKDLQPTRALTAISLLVQKLPKADPFRPYVRPKGQLREVGRLFHRPKGRWSGSLEPP